MLIVLSPAKSLDYTTPVPTNTAVKHTIPELTERAAQLIDMLKVMSPQKLAQLMRISDPLAQPNAIRFESWSPKASTVNAKPAIFAFNGDVYDGLAASTLNRAALDYAQSHIRILSGLYGVLRPFDLLQPYRLEMGTRLNTELGANLYHYWHSDITELLNRQLKLKRAKTVVNLASEEYFKSVRPSLLQADIVTPVFEEWKNGVYKVISFYAKHARGSMARFAAVNRIKDAVKLKEFAENGYEFDRAASSSTVWKFRRRQ